MPSNLPGVDDIAIDARVIAVTALTAMACAMLVGLLPVASLRALRPFEALAGARGVARGTAFAQRALVVAEIVLAVVLLVAASAMARSFGDVLNRDRGFNPRGLEALNVSLPFGDDSYRDRDKRTAAFNAMLDRAAAVPGVRSVAATTGFPGSRLGILTSARITPTPGGTTVVAGVHAASDGYFETMGIPIRAGRSFTRADSVNAPLVAIVNEQLARQFPGGNPIGHRLPITVFGGTGSFEIVGVAGDIHLTGRPGYRVFLSLQQRSTFWIDLVLRAGTGPAATTAVRQALRALDRELLLENESSFQSIIINSLALERAQSGFAVMVGALSAVVAGIGIYALMTFLVTQRRREFGIRLALGSHPRQLFQHALSRALRLVAIGLAAGVLAAALLVRALGSQVFGLTSATAAAYLTAAALIVTVAAVAALIPARRAMKADPLVALRAE
jgi:predicted permease